MWRHWFEIPPNTCFTFLQTPNSLLGYSSLVPPGTLWWDSEILKTGPWSETQSLENFWKPESWGGTLKYWKLGHSVVDSIKSWKPGPGGGKNFPNIIFQIFPKIFFPKFSLNFFQNFVNFLFQNFPKNSFSKIILIFYQLFL